MVFFNTNGGTFRIYEICMKAAGTWPLDRHTRQSKIVFSITLLTQMVISLTSLMHPLATGLSDKAQSYHRARIVFTILQVLSQISIRSCGRSMISLIETTTEDWSSTTVPNECDIMKRHNRTGALPISGVVLYFVWCPIVHARYLPVIESLMGVHEAYEVNDHSISVKLLPYLSYCTALYSIVILLSSLVLCWSLVMHLAGQYKILEKQCQDFLLIKDKRLSRKEFRQIVDRHNELLELSGDLEDSFTVFVGIQIFTTQMFICIETYLVVSGFDGLFCMTTVSNILCILALADLLGLFYYAGDYLTQCDEDIGEVFTQCNWYDLSKESRTNFSIIIARCKKPKTLTAVKMYNLNLSNLKYVFNALYSYMSCIIAVVRATKK